MAVKAPRKRHPFQNIAVAVLLTMALAMFWLGWIVGFREVISPGAIDVSGEVQSNFTAPLTSHAQRVTVSSAPDPLSVPRGQVLWWERSGLGGIWWITFLGEFPGKVVQISNGTGSRVANFTASVLRINYPTFQECFRVGLFDVDYSATIVGKGHLVDIVRASEYDAEVRLTPAFSDVFDSLVFEVSAVRDSSRFFLACNRLNLTADNREYLFNETVYMDIDSFGSLRIDLTVGTAETFRVLGPVRLSMERGSATWSVNRIALSSASGGVIHRGRIEFLGFEELTFLFPARNDETPTGTVYTLEVAGRAARIMIQRAEGPELLTPVSRRAYNVDDEVTRQLLSILASLLFGVVFGVIGDWIRDEWKARRSSLKGAGPEEPPPANVEEGRK